MRSQRVVGISVLSALLVFAATGVAPAAAHRLAPSYLELREEGDRVHVLWKTPRLRAAGAELAPRLPPHCRPVSGPLSEEVPDALVARWQVACGERGLIGASLGASGLAESGTDALVHVTLADGRSFRALLTARAPETVIPERERAPAVLRAYGTLGVEHLLTGLDHVLFLAGLVILVRRGRRLVAAVTAFTAGHCLTLGAATLGFVSAPAALVEVGIAASLVWLACEIARPPGPHTPLLTRHPGLVAVGFGLLHGLGFAGALTDLGLPASSIPLALFSFNMGIELGQLALLAPMVPLVAAVARSAGGAPRWIAELPATAIGSLGVFWILERTSGLW